VNNSVGTRLLQLLDVDENDPSLIPGGREWLVVPVLTGDNALLCDKLPTEDPSPSTTASTRWARERHDRRARRPDQRWPRRAEQHLGSARGRLSQRAEPVELDATIFAPDHARERRSIGRVLPRTQVIRQFTHRGAAATLVGQSIMASVRESEPGPRVNASVVVPR